MQTEEITAAGKLQGTPLTGQGVVPDDAPTCSSCSKDNPSKVCSGCRSAMYCSESCQKKHWVSHEPVCKSINSLEDQLGHKESKSLDDIKGCVHGISPKDRQKLVKLIGEKCTLKVLLNETELEVLWDTGA